MVSRASPVRTCVGCRSRAPASELLRVVAGLNQRVVPDPDHRRPGRGAHVHPDPTCLALAERRRAFGRALRVSGITDTDLLTEFVATRWRAGRPGITDGGESTPDTQGRTTDMSTR